MSRAGCSHLGRLLTSCSQVSGFSRQFVAGSLQQHYLTARALQSNVAGSWALATANARLSSGWVKGKPAGVAKQRRVY